MYLDPTNTVSVGLPPGWAFEPHSSSLTDLVFLDWERPNERQVFVRTHPSQTGAGSSDDEWEAEIRSGLPPLATRIERREGPVLLVERPGAEGRPDQRWAIHRGPRFDAIIEQVGVPVGGPLLTPELAEALRTLKVTVNQQLGEPRAQSEVHDAMLAANKLFHAKDLRSASAELARAREAAQSE